MSSTTHTITLTAKDGTKQVFDAVKRGATEDAAALKAMGQAGAASGKQVASGAKEAEAALKRQQEAVKNLRTGAALLGASFTFASRASQDQARQTDAINRLYGESADAILKVTEAIQDNTNFSNDAARQAAITGATLASNYQLSAEQIGVLIERSANLAQVHGIELADAMSRVSGAIRGEGEAAELLGLNMSDAAVASAAAAAGIDNWNTTMTEGEKAAFRYSLVLEQTNATLGAAQEAHNTTAGTVRGLVNEVQDGAQAFAAWTGPIGEGVAVLSDYALQTGIAVGGVVKLGQGLKELGAGAKVAQAGSAALNLALGPVGVVAAAAAAGFAIYELAKRFDDANLSAKEAESQVKSFDETLAGLGKQGESLDLIGSYRQVIVDLAVTTQNATDQIKFAWADAATAQSAYNEAVVNNKDAETQRTLLAQADAAREYAESLEGLILTEQQLSDVAADFVDIFTDMNPLNADLVIAKMEELKQQLYSGIITSDQYVEAVDTLNASSDSYGLTIEEIVAGERNRAEATDGTTQAVVSLTKAQITLLENSELYKAAVEGMEVAGERYAAMAERGIFVNGQLVGSYREATPEIDALRLAIETAGDTTVEESAKMQAAILADIETIKQFGGADAIGALNQYWGQFITGKIVYDEFGRKVDTVADRVEALNAQQAEQQRIMGSVGDTVQDVTSGMGDAIPVADAFSGSVSGQAARFEDARDAALAYIQTIAGIGSLAGQLRPLDIGFTGGDKVTGIAAELQGAGAAFDSVLGIFKQIDQMGQRNDQAGSIAEQLIGTSEEVGAIVGLLDEGRISQTRFNMTVDAGNNILARSGEIEADLNVIRAKQLPLLDEADARYAKLIDSVSHMTAEQAAATIGFMDANESMKAQELIALAAAAANGELGATGVKAAEDIIAGAVAADPVLEAMLTQIGLVARDHEGNLVVNFDNADSLKSSTDALTEAIWALTASLNGIPTNVDISITATDYASGVAQYVQNVLNGLNGTSVSTTIYLDYVARGDGTGMADGGIVTAAGGRLIGDAQRVRVNEGGREMATLPTGDDVWLPTGSMVTPHAASVMGRGREDRRRGDFNNYGTLIIQANNPAEFFEWTQSYGLGGR
jgi:hypothetical protein